MKKIFYMFCFKMWPNLWRLSLFYEHSLNLENIGLIYTDLLILIISIIKKSYKKNYSTILYTIIYNNDI